MKITLPFIALLSLLCAAGEACATTVVHVEWMRAGHIYGAQTISAGATAVSTGAAPDMGGLGGQVRVTVISGAAVVVAGPNAAATQTGGLRLDQRAQPILLTVAVGDVVSAIEATDALAAAPVTCTGCSGGGGGAVTVANGQDVTEGSTTDNPYTGAGAATLNAALKGIFATLNAPQIIKGRGPATPTQTSVSVAASTSTQLIAANATRRGLVIVPNNGSCSLNDAGGTASATSRPIPGGWSYTELDPPPASAVSAYCTNAAIVSITEDN